MKRALPILLLTAVAVGLWAGCNRTHQTTTASGQVVTGDKAASIERLRDAGTDLQELMNAPDAAVPQEVLKAAKCVAIVPDMVKGGFVVGGLELNGAVIKPDSDSTTAFYGRDLPFEQLLTGKYRTPADAQSFVASVRTAFREAQASSD